MLKSQHFPAFFTVLAGALLPSPALAYIGPGAGLGAIAVTIALVLGVFLLMVGLVWYPLKRLLRKNKQPAVNEGADDKPE
jgi:ABC-type transport system involved in cytochrome bd biosynthesis fused ATPase/permease subunit